MDIKKLAAEGNMEEIERQLMDLDSEFNFKCRECGKRCKHQNTILFNSRDIFHIARKLQLTPEEVITSMPRRTSAAHPKSQSYTWFLAARTRSVPS